MAKKYYSKYNLKIIEALEKLPHAIEDKRHGFVISIEDDKSRSNETRFQHIAKRTHELKVRDIESIPEGIRNYVKFTKSKELKDTYYYCIRRKGQDRGFIQLAIKLKEGESKVFYVKTVFIAYRIKDY